MSSDTEVDKVAKPEKTLAPHSPEIDSPKSFRQWLSDDEENDLNVSNVKPKKTRKIVDSDSEADEQATSETNDNCTKDVSQLEPTDSHSNSHENEEQAHKLIRSDVEEEERSNLGSDQHEENGEIKTKKKLKRIAILDSDSEDESPITVHNKSFNDDLEIPARTSASIYQINKNGELVAESDSENVDLQKSRFSALCDSESSDDGRDSMHREEAPNISELSPKNKRGSKHPKKSVSKSSSKEPSEKKMTGKEAHQQRQEIRSESQRMLRESRLSLPYHKPKTHSIKEFLQNRPRLALLKTDNARPSLAIKMSTEQLKLVTEKLKEREKEVQKFYKSESESDEENLPEEKNSSKVACSSNEGDKDRAQELQSVISGDEKMEEGLELEANRDAEQSHDEISDKCAAESAVTSDAARETVEDADLQLSVDKSSGNLEMLDQPLPDDGELEMDQDRPETIDEASTTKDGNPEEASNKASPAKETVLEGSNNSMEYDFNLDDVEDVSENIAERDVEGEHLQRLLKKYDVVDTPDKECDSSTKKLNKMELLKQLGASKPRLSGGPNQDIDLEEGTAKPSAVAQLMERFMQHNAKKNVARSKLELDIINLSQGEVRKETVTVSVDPEDDVLAVSAKPGLRLKKLKTELQSQIAQRRSELWQQKLQPLNVGKKDDCEDEKSECGGDDEDFLDDEEEAELTDAESTEDEEQYEEEAKDIQKERTQSAFVDDEAEESDAEECDANSQNDEDLEDKLDNNTDCGTMEIQNNEIDTGPKKPLRRILKGFTEDSDEDEEFEDSALDQTLPNTNTENNMNSSTASTDTWEDDDVLPPNQPRADKTPRREMTQSKADLGFLSPVIHLTGLQGLNSGSKFLRESPVSPFSLPPGPSPKEQKWNSTLQKKLFSDSCDTLDSEANMDDIAQLCSGKFISQEIAKLDSNAASIENLAVTTQDLISVCSGSFSGITINTKELGNSPLTENIQTEEGPTKNEILSLNLGSNDEVINLDEDRLISELLDEEEMEQFKKKFESPIASNLKTNSNVDESEQEVMGGGILFDSSEDEDEEAGNRKSSKRLHKKLTFSDDESNSELEQDDDEEISLHDDPSDGDDDETNAHKVVDYDSEENEIENDNEGEVVPQKLKPSDFFEKEAELSESDWDSADEDEKDLDTLEFEQGDADVFDDNKIKADLEKIHMRRVLDQDNQEIKILQELLLEDGELHGTGRQRQFKWKNIDDMGNDDNARGDAEVETYLDEEESEEQWRRARHQREMFLKNKQEKQLSHEDDDIILDDSNSQVIKMGQEAVRKSLSTATANTDNNVKKPPPVTPEVKKPLMLMNTRGSFLARNDKFLTRLAGITKVTTVQVGAPKNSKNFVFQTVAGTTDEGDGDSLAVNKKRKADDGTPTFLKKLRLSSHVSPAVRNAERKKQLFE